MEHFLVLLFVCLLRCLFICLCLFVLLFVCLFVCLFVFVFCLFCFRGGTSGMRIPERFISLQHVETKLETKPSKCLRPLRFDCRVHGVDPR